MQENLDNKTKITSTDIVTETKKCQIKSTVDEPTT